MFPLKKKKQNLPKKTAFASLVVQLLSGSTIFAHFLQGATADAPAGLAQQSGMCGDANGNVQFPKAGHHCIPCPGKAGTRGKIELCHRARSPLLY